MNAQQRIAHLQHEVACLTEDIGNLLFSRDMAYVRALEDALKEFSVLELACNDGMPIGPYNQRDRTVGEVKMAIEKLLKKAKESESS